MSRPAVRTQRLGRRFGRTWALAHLDFEVLSGQSVLVAGSNGSGKTTLLRLLAGLLRPDSGTVSIFGMDPRRQRLSCRRRVALVSHSTFLYDRLTALESMQLWAMILGREGGDRPLIELLAEVGLGERRDSQVATFSAGMRKRLALARARLEQPDLLLLDEPFAALDTEGQHMVEGWIKDSRERGWTVVLASHQIERAAALCDRALFLRQGQRRWSGAAVDLPRDPEVGS